MAERRAASGESDVIGAQWGRGWSRAAQGADSRRTRGRALAAVGIGFAVTALVFAALDNSGAPGDRAQAAPPPPEALSDSADAGARIVFGAGSAPLKSEVRSDAARGVEDAPDNEIPGISGVAPPAPPTAPVEPPKPGELLDPIAAARAEIERACLSVVYPDDFVRRMELNRDGLEDIVIRRNVVCDGYYGAFCGREGCDGSVWIALQNGYYRKLALPPRVEPTLVGETPAVHVTPARGACPEGVRCGPVLLWDGAEFVDQRTFRARQRAALIAAARAKARPAGAQVSAAPSATPPVAATPLGALIKSDLSLLEQARADRWTTAESPDGRLTAMVLSAEQDAALMLSCAPGDAAVELVLRPAPAALALTPTNPGAQLQVEFVVGRNWRIETRTLSYSTVHAAWRDDVYLTGPLISALRRGNRVRARQPGQSELLGYFQLAGSSRILGTLGERCRTAALDPRPSGPRPSSPRPSGGLNAAGGRDAPEESGFDADRFDQDDFDQDRFDQDGFDQGRFDQDDFDQDRFDQDGFDQDRVDEGGFEGRGFDEDGLDQPNLDAPNFEDRGFSEDL